MNRAGPLRADEVLTLAERETGAYGLADAGLIERLGKVVAWANGPGP